MTFKVSCIKMRTMCLILLFQASLQLQCDKANITATIRGNFSLLCKYDPRFLDSKKYWCRGESRSSCEVLVDSDGVTKNTRRAQIIDHGRRGLFVAASDLQFDDAGVYWVGIDKMYADIMTKITVIITEVPVSKPGLWPSRSLADRATCWGQPVTVVCRSASGTAVRYAWYRNDDLLHRSSELLLHCGAVVEDSDFYCVASNNVSSQRSDVLSVQVLVPADSSCIYAVNMQGQLIYECADRMNGTAAEPPPTASHHSDTANQSFINQTHQDLHPCSVQTGVSLWCTLRRWASVAALLIFPCTALKCMKARHKRRG